MASPRSRRSHQTEAELLEKSFSTLHWRQLNSMCLNPPPLPAREEGRISYIPCATVMPTSTPDNPSIKDLHNSELLNGRWRLKPAVVEKRLMHSDGRNKKKQAWKKLPEIVNQQKQGDPPAAFPKTQEKVFLTMDQEDFPDMSDKICIENLSCQAVQEDLPSHVIRKPNAPEVNKDLNCITEGDEGYELVALCAQKLGRKNVVYKLKKAKKIAVKKLKTCQPVRRSDRNLVHEESGKKTKSMQKRDDENLMSEGTFEEEVMEFTGQENVVKIQFEKNDGKVENKKVQNVGVDLKNKLINTHKCSICEKTYENKSNLVRHSVTVHQEVKPHQCEQCEKKFGQKQHLSRHLLTVHQGLKPHQCEQCELKFGLKANLKQHILVIHHGIRDHYCQECNMKFGRKWHLKQHQANMHGGEKYFSCNEHDCDKEFVIKSELANHQRANHSYPKLQCVTRGFSARFTWNSEYIKRKKIAHGGN